MNRSVMYMSLNPLRVKHNVVLYLAQFRTKSNSPFPGNLEQVVMKSDFNCFFCFVFKV